jgi:FG-GAP-like repeat
LPASLNNFEAQFTGDFNNDGKADLFSGTQVALGNSDGTFSLAAPISCSAGFSCVAQAIGDVNGEGILHVLFLLVIDHPELDAVALGNGDGSFGPPISINAYLPVLGQPLILDMNGDGKGDIVFPWQISLLPQGPEVNGTGVLLNTTAPNFSVSASTISPTPGKLRALI